MIVVDRIVNVGLGPRTLMLMYCINYEMYQQTINDDVVDSKAFSHDTGYARASHYINFIYELIKFLCYKDVLIN